MRKWILHNLGLKLLSVFLAIFLWVVVLGEQKVDVTLNVPLTLNIPTTLMLREVTFNEPPGKLAEGENFIPIREDMVRVPRGIQVVDVVPHRIRVVLEALSEREIEVSPRVEGVPAAGFVVRRVISVPARVWMSGPTSEIRRLTQVRTLPVSLSGQMRSFSAQVLLEPVGPLIRIQDGAPIIVEVEIDAKRS
jgi:YbbR domain-containing protein